MSEKPNRAWLDKHGRKAMPRPFLKWAGGKTQLLPRIHDRIPKRFKNYHEPFLGSGAVFFYLLREKRLSHNVHLSDVNETLMDTWTAIRDNVDEVIALLKTHKNEHDYYYEVRSQDPANLSLNERASRMIFLNRTCYNGLYRENNSGQFNVPFGRYANPTICDEVNLRAVSEALQTVELSSRGFDEVADTASKDDFVYLDPPYQPRSATAYFTAYHKSGFGEDDQQRLSEVIQEMDKKGVNVMLSNSDTPYIVALYDECNMTADIVFARRNINRDAKARGKVRELIVRNY